MGIRLLLADPHLMALCGWQQFVTGTEIEVVGQTTDGCQLMELAVQTSPNVVLLELQMPGVSGLALAEQLRQVASGVRVLLTSYEDHPCHKAAAYKTGAVGFVARTASRDALLDAVRRAAAGESLWSRDELRRITGVLATVRSPQEMSVSLTHRECEVLTQMVLGSTNRQIAGSMGISYETVKEHVQHVLEKLGVGDRTQAALWAVRHGLA